MQQLNKKISLFGTICGGLLLGLPAAVQPVSAQSEVEAINPCPRIYYEEPFDSSTLVPEGCPLNTISRQLGINQQTAPVGSTLGNPDQVITNQSAPPSTGVYDRAPYTGTPGGNLPGAPLTPNTISPTDAPTTPAQT
uniref:hypothetical protein n=1 Tax=Oculatella sp. LEGE 06141 TaxID=1828648 RepID=UPI0019DD858C